MKFGKLLDLRGVAFDLPEDHPSTYRVLQAGKGKAPLRIYLGATGWSNKEWVGSWYPPKAKSPEYLKHYARQFQTIELNTTHYRIPKPELVLRWRDMAGKGFKFCPKIPQEISHRHKMQGTAARMALFAETLSLLGNSLGPSFLQLPPYFKPDSLYILENFLNELPEGFPLMIEFRHEDWFSGNAAAETGFELLREKGVGAVITDVAGRRDVLHLHQTTPTLMLRFVGNALHPTDFSRAEDWARRLEKWKEWGLREAYIFVHEPALTQVPEMSIHFAQLMQGLDAEILMPKAIENYQQGSLF